MTKEEMLAVAKPILFNTEMVWAVKDDRKTVTRRVVKPQPFAVKQDENAPCWCGHFVSESGKVLLLTYIGTSRIHLCRIFCGAPLFTCPKRQPGFSCG